MPSRRSNDPFPWYPDSELKPQPGSLLNRDHPLARGLAIYLPLMLAGQAGQVLTQARVLEYISGALGAATAAGQTTLSPTPDIGSAIRFNGVSGSEIQFTPLILTTGFLYRDALTVIAKVAWTTGQTFVPWINDLNSANTLGGFSLGIEGTSSGAAFRVTTVGDLTGTALTVGTWGDGIWRTMVGQWATQANSPIISVYDLTGRRLERVVSGSAVTGPLRPPDTLSLGFSSATYTGDLEWAGVWNRVLTDDEQMSLAVDPYQILLDRPAYRWWAFAAAVAIVSLGMEMPILRSRMREW